MYLAKVFKPGRIGTAYKVKTPSLHAGKLKLSDTGHADYTGCPAFQLEPAAA